MTKARTCWKKENKEKCRAYTRKYRAAHPVRVRRLDRASSARFFKRRAAWFAELKNRPCMDCKKKYHPVCMDFDHVRGRKFFSIGTSRKFSKKRILTEIAKCDLVCSNCHRLRTHSVKGD